MHTVTATENNDQEDQLNPHHQAVPRLVHHSIRSSSHPIYGGRSTNLCSTHRTTKRENDRAGSGETYTALSPLAPRLSIRVAPRPPANTYRGAYRPSTSPAPRSAETPIVPGSSGPRSHRPPPPSSSPLRPRLLSSALVCLASSTGATWWRTR